MTPTPRLKALDGLRGIAIILVILSHLPTEIWHKSVPFYLDPVVSILTGNGKVGVSILFFLTGFLMAWLYPQPKSVLSFWARRYARLFPAFLVMVVSLTLIRSHPEWGVGGSILVVFFCALIARGIWEGSLVLNRRLPFGRFLLLLWLVVQLGVAVWYANFLLKVPPQVFYELWDPDLRLWVAALINGTLTLPFGNYIGQLDGVYWSLVTEVLFYLLYPVFFIPLFNYVNKFQSKVWRVLVILSVFPFCFGLNLIFSRILGFAMILPQFFIYFIAGVLLGLNLPWFQKNLSNWKLLLTGYGFIFILMLNLLGVLSNWGLSSFYSPWYVIMLVLPMTLLVGIATLDSASWSKWLTKKWLVNLGKYSYSLYLTHALAIELTRSLIPVNNLWGATFQIILSFFLAIILALGIYHIIESPYYSLPKSSAGDSRVRTHLWTSLNIGFKKFYIEHVYVFIVLMLIFSYIAFRLPIAIFSYSYPEGGQSIIHSAIKEDKEVIFDKPLALSFQAKNDNLGMILSNLHAKVERDASYSELWIRLREEKDKKIIAQSSFNPNLISDSRFHSFGFPQQQNSGGNNYVVEYEIVPANLGIKVELTTTENKFVPIYFVEKNRLFSDSKILFGWLGGKLSEPLYNSLYWFSILMIGPLLVSLLLIRFTAKRNPA